MVALNFTARFAPMVESGVKRQTIRKTRRGIIQGTTLQLYTGMRTKACWKLLESDPVCHEVIEVEICDDRVRVGEMNVSAPSTLDAFAKADGFTDFDDMKAWFEIYDAPFRGFLITWGNPPRLRTH